MSVAAPSSRADRHERNDRIVDAIVAAVVAVVGLAYYGFDYDFRPGDAVVQGLVVLGMAAAAGLFRRAPGAALTLVWVSCGLQVLQDEPIQLVEAAAVLVAFGTARYGSITVLWLSGLSIPAGSLAILVAVRRSPGTVLDFVPRELLMRVSGLGGLLAVGVFGLLVLVAPWLLGLLLRSQVSTLLAREREATAEVDRVGAERARAQAQEVAELRERQNQLARDVHDVVGHSLAVILAQAESAQYLPPEDPARMQETMANIATSARQSLRDVRQVLATSQAGPPGLDETQPLRPQRESLETLLAGVQATGNDVRSTVVGQPQPLPPELELVAYRVLQEMLTNALKHGRRGEPVLVEQHWEGELRLEVRNVVDPGGGDAGHAGRGLGGMRERLESVGGRWDVRRRAEPAGDTFTVTAWLPVRG